MYDQARVANITGGPLDYNYPVHSVSLHYGLRDNSGSEHTVDGKSFPGEVNLCLIPYMQSLTQGFPRLRELSDSQRCNHATLRTIFMPSSVDRTLKLSTI